MNNEAVLRLAAPAWTIRALSCCANKHLARLRTGFPHWHPLRASRGSMNSFSDAVVSPAAADVCRHEFCDPGISGMRSLGQQRGGGHDLPALAVSALRNVFGDPRILQWM